MIKLLIRRDSHPKSWVIMAYIRVHLSTLSDLVLNIVGHVDSIVKVALFNIDDSVLIVLNGR